MFIVFACQFLFVTPAFFLLMMPLKGVVKMFLFLGIFFFSLGGLGIMFYILVRDAIRRVKWIHERYGRERLEKPDRGIQVV